MLPIPGETDYHLFLQRFVLVAGVRMTHAATARLPPGTVSWRPIPPPNATERQYETSPAGDHRL